MSVLDRIADEFDSDVQERGREYFRAGRVEIVSAASGRISAQVSGGETYEVEIRCRSSGWLRGSCNCRYAEDHDTCKHMWATLLQAESDGLLPAGLAHAESFLSRVVSPVQRVQARAAQKGISIRPASEIVPPWKQQLAELRRRMQHSVAPPAIAHPWPANRRVAYVLGVGARTYGESSLSITLGSQMRERSNGWGTPRQLKLTREQIPSLPEEADRVIVQMLAGMDRQSYYRGPDGAIDVVHTLEGGDSGLLLHRICQTGRCYWRDDEGGRKSTIPVEWDEGPAWELWLQIVAEPDGERYTLDASLRRGEERIDCRKPSVVLSDGLMVIDGRIARLEHFGAFPVLMYLRSLDRKLGFNVHHGDELLADLLAMQPLPRLDLPPALRIETVSPSMRPRLKISPPPKQEYGSEKLMGELSFDYGGRLIGEQEVPTLFDPTTRMLLRRDMAAEAAAMARLDELKFKNQWAYEDGGQKRRLAASRLNKVVLQLCTEGWGVEADGKLYRQAGEFKMEVSSGIDWFDLEGSIDFGGVIARLPRLLAALRRGEKTVQLDDGTIGILSDEWLSRYGLLARIAPKGDEEHVRFSRGQVGLLDALVIEMPQATCDAAFERARDEMRRFEGIAPMDPPQGFVGTLRPYQRQGLGWLHFLERFGFCGCLADDMGLGKTIQVLALLEGKRQAKQPSLVVVPRSLIFNWVEEARRFTPNLRILDHSGIGRARSPERFADYDIILTTYGTLRLDAPFLKDFQFAYAILDEAQAIKNGSSESAKAARLIRADHRLVMSGTPVQNHLGELWSIFEFLNPGMLGGATVFKVGGAGSAQVERQGRELLARALRPFILRRTKEQVAPELPEKTEQTIHCDMEPAQRKMYDELREHYRASLLDRIAAEGINKSKIQILEALLRLRQAACHPGLIDKKLIDHPSAKLDALLPQLDEVMEENHKALVFSQFTSMLAIVRRQLDKRKVVYEYLDGKTKDRQARVERFQNDPDCKLFLISLKAGGLGLNLTAAEYVFLLDPWWNPAIEAQAIDRAHRIGQTQKVFAYRFIANDTVEQKVLELQSRKKQLADMIINADNSLISQLGREDLELLLS